MVDTSKKAAALHYDPARGNTPIISAAGSGLIAEQIIKTATEHDVPIIQDAQAAQVLSQFAPGDVIPPELYAVVAEILVFLARTDDDFARKLNNATPG